MSYRTFSIFSALILAWLPAGPASAQETPAPSPAASPTPAATTEDARIEFGPDHTGGTGENIGAAGGFSAELWLSPNRVFVEDWKKPGPLTLSTSRHPSRDSALYTVILFSGAQAGPNGLCNVSYDITITRPDGTPYVEHKDVIALQGLAPPGERPLQLARDYTGLALGAQDPAGTYTVNVVVKDNVARVEVPLKTSFVLQ